MTSDDKAMNEKKTESFCSNLNADFDNVMKVHTVKSRLRDIFFVTVIQDFAGIGWYIWRWITTQMRFFWITTDFRFITIMNNWIVKSDQVNII